MPRQAPTRITDRQETNPEFRAPVQTQVEARNIDFLSGSTPNPHGDLDGLLNGLRSLSPALQSMQDMADAKVAEDRKLGATVRAAGGAKDDSQNEAWVHGYMALDGTVKGEADALEAETAYDTEFDKDGGDLESFINTKFSERTKGLKPGAFLDGYSASFVPAMVKVRAKHLDYQKKQVTGTVESNAMQLMDGGMRAYLNAGQPIPDEYIASIKGHVGSTLGVSEARFNDLMFASMKRLGDEGNFAVYDTLKRPRADGSAGLYYDPAWKERIDQAQIHSNNVFLQKDAAATKAMKEQREEAQEVAMFEIMDVAATDPKQAQVMFTALRKSGKITRASDLAKWEKVLTESVDGAPAIHQNDNESLFLANILKGGGSQEELFAAEARGAITNGQLKSLLRERRSYTVQQRAQATADRAASAADDPYKVYRNPLFTRAESHLSDMLRPRQNGETDFMGIGNQFDRAEQANAKAELAIRMRGRTPEEAMPIVQEISDRYMKRREYFDPMKNPSANAAIGAGRNPFKTIADVRAAAKAGALSPEEVRAQANLLKSQQLNGK